MAAGMARTRSFTGQLMFDPPNEGDGGSNATCPHRRYRSTPATFSALAIRPNREVVTPRNRVTTAPEYPNRFTATWQSIFRARTACRFRSPPPISASPTPAAAWPQLPCTGAPSKSCV